jgi:hypothetical protein
VLPPKRHDPIKAGIRERLRREKHQKLMLELNRELEKTRVRWKGKEAEIRARLT